MDEEETMGEDVGALSAMGGIDFAQLKSDPMGLIQSVYDRQLAAEAAREKTQRELFERGEENIRARNAGMSQSEKLFAISQALLAPRKYRGIAGTIGKLSGAFGDIAEADRKARLAREAELERFRNSYLSGVADRGVTSARTAAELVKTAATLSKPRDPGVWDSNLGRYVPKDRPVAIKSGVLQGRKIVSYSDGTSRLYGAGGNPKAYEVLDAAGDVIGEGAD